MISSAACRRKHEADWRTDDCQDARLGFPALALVAVFARLTDGLFGDASFDEAGFAGGCDFVFGGAFFAACLPDAFFPDAFFGAGFGSFSLTFSVTAWTRFRSFPISVIVCFRPPKISNSK